MFDVILIVNHILLRMNFNEKQWNFNWIRHFFIQLLHFQVLQRNIFKLILIVFARINLLLIFFIGMNFPEKKIKIQNIQWAYYVSWKQISNWKITKINRVKYSDAHKWKIYKRKYFWHALNAVSFFMFIFFICK